MNLLKKAISSSTLLSLPFSLAYGIYMNPPGDSGIKSGASFTAEGGIHPPPPAMVSILDFTDPGTSESQPIIPYSFKIGTGHIWQNAEHDCAATLIANDASHQKYYLLTAAHCVTDENQNGFFIDVKIDKTIIFGAKWAETSSQPNQAKFPQSNVISGLTNINAVYITQSWVNNAVNKEDRMDGDLAILEMNGTPPNNIKPMAIAHLSQSERGGIALTVAGWGTTSPKDLYLRERWSGPTSSEAPLLNMQTTPNFADVTSLQNDECQALITNANLAIDTRNDFPFIEENYLCAGTATESTACYGDSGGPLYQQNTQNGKTTYTLYGVVSYSPALCQATLCDSADNDYTCISNTPNAHENSVPHVYAAPGALLCDQQKRTEKLWYQFNQHIDGLMYDDYKLKTKPTPINLPDSLLNNLTCE